MAELGKDTENCDKSENLFTMDEAFLKDLLECSVCLEQLDSSSKMLPCQHTFCKLCLLKILNLSKRLRCPLCRTPVDAKIGELPCNILLVRLLESKKNSIQPKKVNGSTDIPSRSADTSSSSNEQPTSSHPQLPQRIGNMENPSYADLRMDPKQLATELLEEALLMESETETPTPQPSRSKRKKLDEHFANTMATSLRHFDEATINRVEVIMHEVIVNATLLWFAKSGPHIEDWSKISSREARED